MTHEFTDYIVVYYPYIEASNTPVWQKMKAFEFTRRHDYSAGITENTINKSISNILFEKFNNGDYQNYEKCVLLYEKAWRQLRIRVLFPKFSFHTMDGLKRRCYDLVEFTEPPF